MHSSSIISSSNSSSTQPFMGSELPSVSDILDMSAAESAQHCTKLGIARQKLKRDNQIALIDFVKAEQSRCEAEAAAALVKLPFDRSPTSFTWTFSEEQLKECDALDKSIYLSSKKFTDNNGVVWELHFYPKGVTRSPLKKAALFLAPINLTTAGVRSVQVTFNFCHVETGVSMSFTNTIKADNNGVGVGVDNFTEIPSSVSPTEECSICFDTFNDEKSALALPCEHTFCADCIENWLSENHNCPLCRSPVPHSYEPNTSRYSPLTSFTVKVTMTTELLEKGIGAVATLGDVMRLAESMENKFEQISEKISRMSQQFSQQMTGSKRNFSEMSSE